MKSFIVEFATDEDKQKNPQCAHGQFKIKGELIRCRDCKHFYQSKKQRDLRVCDHSCGCASPIAEGHCNYAERREKRNG